MRGKAEVLGNFDIPAPQKSNYINLYISIRALQQCDSVILAQNSKECPPASSYRAVAEGEELYSSFVAARSIIPTVTGCDSVKMDDCMRCEESKILVFDIETTGVPLDLSNKLTLGHEILQLAMIDGSGNVLLNRLFKPENCVYWPNAEAVHGIEPNDVRNSPSIKEYITDIQRLIDNAELLIAYNFQFDYIFLRSIGVIFKDKVYCDVMKLFSHYRKQNRYASLQKCVDYCGGGHAGAHNALNDARATLFCYRKLVGDSYEQSRT